MKTDASVTAICAGGAPQEISRGQVRTSGRGPRRRLVLTPLPRRGAGGNPLRDFSDAPPGQSLWVPVDRGLRSAGRVLPPANFLRCPPGRTRKIQLHLRSRRKTRMKTDYLAPTARSFRDPVVLECGDWSPLLRRRLVAVKLPCVSGHACVPSLARAVNAPAGTREIGRAHV